MSTKTAAKPISAKQISFLTTLMNERVNGALYVDTQLAAVKADSIEELTSHEASNIIGVLLGEPKIKAAAKSTGTNFVTEAGIYCVDGEIFKVQKAVHGSGHLYAKRLVVRTVETCGGCENCDGENLCEKKKGVFEFAKGAMKNITPAHKMSLEQAVEFGALYGVCCNCGATLTDEKSIEAGIGPVCAKKF